MDLVGGGVGISGEGGMKAITVDVQDELAARLRVAGPLALAEPARCWISRLVFRVRKR